MLEKNLSKIHNKFKMSLYSKVFNRVIEGEDSLSAIEVLCVELIYALGTPTIHEFANFAQISAPNAAYKVSNLVKKGYVRKVRSQKDRREYHLEVIDKYKDIYGMSNDYLTVVVERIRERFSIEEVKKFEEVSSIVVAELMPEVKLPQEY